MSEYGNDWDYDGEINEKNEELDKNECEETKSEELNEAFNPNKDVEDPFAEYEDFNPNEDTEDPFAEYEDFDPNEEVEDPFAEYEDWCPEQEFKNETSEGVQQEEISEFKKIDIKQDIKNGNSPSIQNFNEYLRENLYKDTQLGLSEKSKIVKLTQNESLTEEEKKELQSILSKFSTEELAKYFIKDVEDNSMLGEDCNENLNDFKNFEDKDLTEDFIEAIKDHLDDNNFNRNFIEKTEEELKSSDLSEDFTEKIGNMLEISDFDKEVIDRIDNKVDKLLKNNDCKNENKEGNAYIEIQRIKEEIRNINWEDITKDWTIYYRRNKNSEDKIIQLDPKQDSSAINPLYKHKDWLKQIYNDENLNLNDTIIGEMCGVHKSTIGKWRKIHDIPTKLRGSGQWIDKHGYVRMYMPEDYKHPELMSHRGEGKFIRFEHAVVMERYLSDHPELEWSKKYLIDEKYLKKGTIIHHINYIHQDNKIENLYIFENDALHKKAKKPLFECFSDLIKLNQIDFKNGKYHLNRHIDYKNLGSSEIKEILKPIRTNYYEDINLVKENIKNLNWDKISDDWTIKYRINKFTSYKTISLDPYSDCSEKNPLYCHKAWVERLVNDENFNLTDTRLGEVYGVSRAKIVYWRKNVHNIYTRKEGWGFNRFFQNDGRVWIKVPEDYDNPFAKKHNGYMAEHRYIMEQYTRSSRIRNFKEISYR